MFVSAMQLLAAAAAAAAPQCAKFDPVLRANCGIQDGGAPVASTEALCIARGCCWDNSSASIPVAATAAAAAPYNCMSGIASTPKKGVEGTSVWTTHVKIDPPLQAFPTVDVAIQGSFITDTREGPV